MNSASQDLQLDTGSQTVTQSIGAAAGKDAQTCLKHVRRPVPVGTVVVGTGGNLPCKAIFHAVLEKFEKANKIKSVKVIQ